MLGYALVGIQRATFIADEGGHLLCGDENDEYHTTDICVELADSSDGVQLRGTLTTPGILPLSTRLLWRDECDALSLILTVLWS